MLGILSQSSVWDWPACTGQLRRNQLWHPVASSMDTGDCTSAVKQLLRSEKV